MGPWGWIGIRGWATAGRHQRPKSKVSLIGADAGDNILVTHKFSYADHASLGSILSTAFWAEHLQHGGEVAGYHGW